MYPTPPSELATIESVLRALSDMLMTREPAFVSLGFTMTIAAMVIRTVMTGGDVMTKMRDGGAGTSALMHLLITLGIAFTMINFYESPIPGFGVSFPGLISDQARAVAALLDARALDNTIQHLDSIMGKFLVPSWGLLGSIAYIALMIVVAFAKGMAIIVIAYAYIATAVCRLFGPLFIAFFLIPQLDRLFWGWLMAYIQYVFMPAIGFGVLLIFSQFVQAWTTQIPAGVSIWDAPLYLWGTMSILAAFIYGVWQIPSLTASIFSGHASGGGSGLLSIIRR